MSSGDDHGVAVPQLKFDKKHVEPILKGKKTVTLRVDIEREHFEIGRHFQLVDEDGERFASAIVDDRGWTSIDMAARMDRDGHQNYRDTEELLETMREYYPEMDLEPTSKVEIIYWDWEELWE